MESRTIKADVLRAESSRVIDDAIAGQVTIVERYGRKVAVVVGAKMWDQILADYERLDRAEDLAAIYANKIKS